MAKKKQNKNNKKLLGFDSVKGGTTKEPDSAIAAKIAAESQDRNTGLLCRTNLKIAVIRGIPYVLAAIIGIVGMWYFDGSSEVNDEPVIETAKPANRSYPLCQ